MITKMIENRVGWNERDYGIFNIIFEEKILIKF